MNGHEHLALVHGDPAAVVAPLVRIQSSCLTGTAFLAELCDCRQQLHLAMERVVKEGAGVVLYLDQEGRSHGLVEKVAQLDLIAGGADTVDAARARGKDVDLRRYDEAAVILRELVGPRPVRLLTNNPEKLTRVVAEGVEIAQRIPLETAPTPGNREYLRVKRTRMGHLLSQVD
jgi:GTP cyclohydrolase II